MTAWKHPGRTSATTADALSLGHALLRLTSLGVLSSIALALGGCDSRYVTVRYRVTMTVDDAGATRSASGVWRYSLKKVGLPLASPYHGRFEGGPIALRLSDGRTLSLLTSGRYGPELAASFPENLFGAAFSGSPSDRMGKIEAVARMTGARRSLDCDYAKPAVYLPRWIDRANHPCLMLGMAPAGDPAKTVEQADLHGERRLHIERIDIEIVP